MKTPLSKTVQGRDEHEITNPSSERINMVLCLSENSVFMLDLIAMKLIREMEAINTEAQVKTSEKASIMTSHTHTHTQFPPLRIVSSGRSKDPIKQHVFHGQSIGCELDTQHGSNSMIQHQQYHSADTL